MVRSGSGLYRSGVVREILAPINFAFDNLTGPQTIIVAEHVDIGTLVEASFVTRFHSGTIAGTGTITVSFKPQGWTLEDPTMPLISPADLAPAATSGGKTNPPPFLGLSSVSANAGPLALVEVVGSPNGICTALISIYLVAKGGTSLGNTDGFNTFIGFPG